MAGAGNGSPSHFPWSRRRGPGGQIARTRRRPWIEKGTAVLAADLLQYSRPWGFSLGEVTTMVHLWHGEQDPKVPITVARQMTVMLPHCQAHFGAGGHMMASDHAGEILTALTSAFEQDVKEH